MQGVFTKILNLWIPNKTDKGTVVTDVFEPSFTKLDQYAETTNETLTNLENNKLDKGTYIGDAGTLKGEIDTKLDKGTYGGNAQDLYDGISTLQTNKLERGNLPANIQNAEVLLYLLTSNAGLNFDNNILFIQNIGTKTAGRYYFDSNTKGLFRCKTTTTSTNNDSNFVDESNNALRQKINTLGANSDFFWMKGEEIIDTDFLNITGSAIDNVFRSKMNAYISRVNSTVEGAGTYPRHFGIGVRLYMSFERFPILMTNFSIPRDDNTDTGMLEVIYDGSTYYRYTKTKATGMWIGSRETGGSWSGWQKV